MSKARVKEVHEQGDTYYIVETQWSDGRYEPIGINAYTLRTWKTEAGARRYAEQKGYTVVS